MLLVVLEGGDVVVAHDNVVVRRVVLDLSPRDGRVLLISQDNDASSDLDEEGRGWPVAYQIRSERQDGVVVLVREDRARS